MGAFLLILCSWALYPEYMNSGLRVILYPERHPNKVPVLFNDLACNNLTFLKLLKNWLRKDYHFTRPANPPNEIAFWSPGNLNDALIVL
jgi:hypothetical protein